MKLIELEEFVRETIASIKAGVGGNGHMNGPIEFNEVNVVRRAMGGDAKLLVVSGEGNFEKESVQKISFDVDPDEPNNEGPSHISPWIPEVDS